MKHLLHLFLISLTLFSLTACLKEPTVSDKKALPYIQYFLGEGAQKERISELSLSEKTTEAVTVFLKKSHEDRYAQTNCIIDFAAALDVSDITFTVTPNRLETGEKQYQFLIKGNAPEGSNENPWVLVNDFFKLPFKNPETGEIYYNAKHIISSWTQQIPLTENIVRGDKASILIIMSIPEPKPSDSSETQSYKKKKPYRYKNAIFY